jgi:hypothetical protein
MPHCSTNCQDNFTILLILSQIGSFISYDLKNIVNDGMDGMKLDDYQVAI